jgi:Flp pilus assembly protein TadB
MTRTYFVVLVFVLVALVALAVVWWYARRVKDDLDDSSRIVAGARGIIELNPASTEQLRRLSAEPILIKQSEEGVRVQIEHRPMMPLMAFLGKEVSTALTEAAAEVTERYGMKWVVLVSVAQDDRVTVQRLA